MVERVLPTLGSLVVAGAGVFAGGLHRFVLERGYLPGAAGAFCE